MTQLIAVPDPVVSQLIAVPDPVVSRLAAVPDPVVSQLAAVPDPVVSQLAAVPDPVMSQLAAVPDPGMSQLTVAPNNDVPQLSAAPAPAVQAVPTGGPARRPRPVSPVPPGARPSAARAAAAARLVGAGSTARAGVVLPDPRWRGLGLRHLGVVPAPTRTAAQRRRRARALLLAGIGLGVTVAFGLVYLHVVLAQRQFALDRMTAKVQVARTDYQNLRLQVAQLSSPLHVISTAEGQLGMRQPGSVTYLTPSVTIKGQGPLTNIPIAAKSGAKAPTGDANWPLIKSQLAGSP
jgi:cell division protein FtsL